MKVWTCIKLIVLGAVLLAAGVGVRIVSRETAPERVREVVYAALSAAVNGKVSLEAARLDYGGVLHLENLAVSLPGESEPAFSCPSIRIYLDRLELLGRRTVARRVEMVSPTLRLAHDRKSDKWNAESVLAAGRGEGAAAAPPREGVDVENATVLVSDETLFGDAEPRSYPALHLSFRPDQGEAGRWLLDGRVLAGVTAGARLSGWLAAKGKPRFWLEVTCQGIQAGEALWRQVPHGHAVWKDFRLTGGLAVQGSLSGGGGAPLDYSFRVAMSEAEAWNRYYPVAIRSLSGQAEITTGRVILRDLTGVIPPEEFGVAPANRPLPRVSANATWDLGRDGGGRLEILASDMPISRGSIERIPSVGPEIWTRLKPEGQGRLALTLIDPGRRAPTRFSTVVELDGVSLRPPEVPVPLRNVTGTLLVDNEWVRLRNLTGVVGDRQNPQDTPPYFVADGAIDLQRRESALTVSVRNLHTTEELVKSVPGAGDDIWRLLRPRVVMDGSFQLSDIPDGNAMTCTALLDLHGGELSPEFTTFPLREVSGTVRYDGGRILIESLAATVTTDRAGAESSNATCMAEVRGTVEPKAQRAEVYLTARGMTISRELLRCVPGVGEHIWQEAEPRGTANLSGRFFYDASADPPLRYVLDMDLRDVSAALKLIPIPLDVLSGQLLLSEERAISNNFNGVTCGGGFSGAAVVYFGAEEDLPSFGGRLSFNEMELRELVRCLSGEEKPLSGRISGVMDVGGLLGQRRSVSARGTLSLVEGHLWQTPFFAKLLSVLHLSMPAGQEVPARGQMTYTLKGDEVTVHEFELVGGGLSLSGYGKVWLDGRLDLTMAAVGAPEKRTRIPVLSHVVGWALRAMERELVRLDVSGTLGDPKIKPTVLSTITWPLTSLTNVLSSPFFRGGSSSPGAAR
jgi:hypothetical protein